MSSFKASLQLVTFMLVFGPAAVPQEPTFNAQANVVVVPTLVRDANGSVVYGLQAKDFIIEDDGVEQVPYLDEAAEGEPVSLMIAVQMWSQSMARICSNARCRIAAGASPEPTRHRNGFGLL